MKYFKMAVNAPDLTQMELNVGHNGTWYVLPVLHIQMAQVNKAFDHLNDWIDTNIEWVDSREHLLRKHVSNLLIGLIQLKTEHDEIEHTKLTKKGHISIKWQEFVYLLKLPNLKMKYSVK